MNKQNLELCSIGGNRKWIYVHANSAFTPQGGRVLEVLDILGLLDIDDEFRPRAKEAAQAVANQVIKKAIKKVVCRVARKSNETAENSTGVAEKAAKNSQGSAAERVGSLD